MVVVKGLTSSDNTWGEEGPPTRDMCSLSVGDSAAILYVSGPPQFRGGCEGGAALVSHWEVPVTVSHHIGGPQSASGFNLLMRDPRHTRTPPDQGEHLLAAWFSDQGAHFSSFLTRVSEDGAATAQPSNDYSAIYNFPSTVPELQSAYADLQTTPQTHCLGDQSVAEIRSHRIEAFRSELDCTPGEVAEDNINVAPGPSVEDDANNRD